MSFRFPDWNLMVFQILFDAAARIRKAVLTSGFVPGIGISGQTDDANAHHQI